MESGTGNHSELITSLRSEISQLRKINRVLTDDLTRFQTLLEKTQAALVVEDQERKIILTNQEFCDLFAIPHKPEELIGSNCSKASDLGKNLLADPEAFPRRINSILRTRQPVYAEEIVFANGTICERDYIPVFDDNNQFIGHVWQYRNITLHKEKDTELLKHNHLLQLIAWLASSFINLPLNSIDANINEAIKQIGLFVKVDRVYIFKHNYEQRITTNTHEWCAEGINAEIDNLQATPFEYFPGILETFQNGGIVYIPSVAKMPKEDPMRTIFKEQGIRSLLLLPLVQQDINTGFIGFDAVKRERVFNEKDINLLKIFAKLLSNIEERRRTANLLKTREEQLKTILDKSPAVIYTYRIIDGKPDLIYINENLENVLGYKPEVFIGHMEFWEQCVHPDDLPGLSKKLRGEDNFYEYRFLDSSGRYRWISDYQRKIADTEGLPVTIGAWWDNTERIKTVKALKASEKRYRAIVEDQTELVCRFTPEGVLTFVNEAYCRYFNQKPVDLLGENFFNLIPEEDQKLIKQHYAQFTPQNAVVTYEHQVILPDNEIRQQQRVDRAIYNDEGVLIELQGVGRDITERKKAEEELFALKRFNESIVQTVNEGIIMINDDGKVTFANTALLQMLGYNQAELLNKHWRDIVPTESHSIVEAADERRKAGIIDRYELKFIHKSGSLIPTQVSGSPYYNHKNGEMSGTIAILTNITEQKKSEAEIAAKNRLLELLNAYTLEQTKINHIDSLIDLVLNQLVDYTGAEIAVYCEYIEKEKGLRIRKIKTDQMIDSQLQTLAGEELTDMCIPVSPKFLKLMTAEVVSTFDSLLESTDEAISKTNANLLNQVLGVNNYIGIAFVSENNIFGTVLLCFKSEQPDQQLHFLKSYAHITAITLKRIYSEEDIRYISMHDRLTGLYNRHYFEEELKRLDQSREHPIAVISADLDGLKLINDIFGHAEGDQLLQAGAVLLKRSLRASDILARVGGDEFAVLLPRTGKKAVLKLISRIYKSLEEKNTKSSKLPLSISFGMAVSESKEKTLSEKFQEADNAMYQDKIKRSKNARTAIIDKLLESLNDSNKININIVNQVQELSLKLGNIIKLSDTQLSNIALLARIRDLGHIIIPEDLLQQNKMLTDKERDIICQHSEAGYRIALSSPELAGIADLILKHHEHYDGSGYPLGLKDDKIPVECQIVAICAAYAAMINQRNYAAALSQEEALCEINKCAGTMFNPDLVSDFSRMVRNHTCSN